MLGTNSVASRLWSAVTLDRSFIERVEKDPRVTWRVIGVVVAAGAGRGVTPGFEAGWLPVVSHGLAAILIWLVCAGLIWNVAHRIFGYSEGFSELARVLGFPAVPLLGLWLNVIPVVGGLVWFTIGLHGVAFLALVGATRVALGITLVRALGVCSLSLAMAVLLLAILGLFLVGSPASAGISASPIWISIQEVMLGEGDAWIS